MGRIQRVAGQVVDITGLPDLSLNTIVHIGEDQLLGEVIRLTEQGGTVQVYESTSGLRVGEMVADAGEPLSVTLGPGLLSSVYDGLQRPLNRMADDQGIFVAKGVDLPPLSNDATWAFTPTVAEGDDVQPVQLIGTVPETKAITHRVTVPPGVSGTLTHIVEEGEYTVEDVIAVVDDAHEIRLQQRWPVRQPRPLIDRVAPEKPLITGQRILDAFFPVALGGTAIVPGGFGTGKTVIEQSLAQWSAADIIIYIGCGERGNEMAEVLEEFPQLEGIHTGRPIIERTVLIANTSNMPVSAREASIYTGTAIGEYYRDMGYDVLLLADSTSRWGEALREISGRLEEIPAEGGFPAYLGSRLAQFYERAGRTTLPDGRTGSLTITGAVSPPAGDFSEPITQHSMRVAGAMWALDRDLARRRHFPAVSWSESYTLYELDSWFTDNIHEDWETDTRWATSLLQEAEELEDIVQLIGPDSLADADRLTLQTARLLKEDYLQQSAFDEIDRHCSPEKNALMLQAIHTFHTHAGDVLEREDMTYDQIQDHEVLVELSQMKGIPDEAAEQQINALIDDIRSAL